MKKLLGLILLTFVLTGFSGIAKSTPISATEFHGYRIEINMDKLNDLYSRILGQPKIAPIVRFRENPNHTDYLALFDPDKYEILFYFPNWLSSDTRNREVFEKEVIRVLAHECGHAIGWVDQPPFPDAQLHKKIQGYIEIMLLIFNPVVILILGIIGILALKWHYTKIGVSAISIIFISLAILNFLAYQRESLTDKIGNELTSQYGAEFHEIVKVTKK